MKKFCLLQTVSVAALGVLVVSQSTHAQQGTPQQSAKDRVATNVTAKTSGVSTPEISDDEIRDVVTRVAKHQIRPLADGDYPKVTSVSEARAAKAPQGIEWVYPWGVTLYGMTRASEVTGDTSFKKFVAQHNEIAARYYEWLAGLKKSITNDTDLTSFYRSTKIARLMALGNLDSCGAMGVQMYEGVQPSPQQQATAAEKQVLERIADWILNRQDRLPDGTLWRARQMDGTVWPDDLYMGCPFIVRWAKFSNHAKYLDDAANQIIHQAALEQDSDGLFFHGYFMKEKKHAPFKWGRGNGWVTVATVEVLSALPENHPARAKLIDILRKQIDGLKPLQTPNGMWRQVLDKPELWEETSCTAMFAYGIARAVNRGWLDASYMPMARKAFAGISQNVTADGGVNGTCEGTNIGLDLEFYANRKRPDDDQHGRGPVLLAGSEILASAKK